MNMTMLTIEKLYDLHWQDADQTLTHLSAASGLAVIGERFYVVADDDVHLGAFALDNALPGQRVAVFPDDLPQEKSARKKCKPDLEALLLLPPEAHFPFGSLLALGSGSTARRRRAAQLALDASGAIHGAPQSLDFSPLFLSLETHVVDLNIEGALVLGKQLVLLQRGNQQHPRSALIFCPLDSVLQFLQGTAVNFTSVLTIVDCTLPTINGVVLSFTDGTPLPDGNILFSAVAENTADSYRDGECVGAALGVVTPAGKILCCQALAQPHKIEGVALHWPAGKPEILLVTDADNPSIPAALLRINHPMNVLHY